MIFVTVSGNVGNDSQIGNAGGSSVLNFSVAGTAGYGGRAQTIWFRCAIWGKRGETLQQYIKKGSRVTVVGEMSTEIYNGETQHKINVADIKLQDSQNSSGQQQAAPRQQQAQQSQPAPQQNSGDLDFDDDVPF